MLLQLGPACDGAARGGAPPPVVIPGTSSGACPLPSLSLRWCFAQGIWSFPRRAEERGPSPQLPGPPSWPAPRGHLQSQPHVWAAPGRSRETVGVLLGPLAVPVAAAHGSRARVASPLLRSWAFPLLGLYTVCPHSWPQLLEHGGSLA